MTRRRRLLVFGLLAAALALLGGTSLMSWLEPKPTPGITAENADRIRKGMTLADVESLMGGQERWESFPALPGGAIRPPRHEIAPDVWVPDKVGAAGVRSWRTDTVSIDVRFSSNDHVRDFLVRSRRETPLEMLRRWLHL